MDKNCLKRYFENYPGIEVVYWTIDTAREPDSMRCFHHLKDAKDYLENMNGMNDRPTPTIPIAIGTITREQYLKEFAVDNDQNIIAIPVTEVKSIITKAITKTVTKTVLERDEKNKPVKTITVTTTETVTKSPTKTTTVTTTTTKTVVIKEEVSQPNTTPQSEEFPISETPVEPLNHFKEPFFSISTTQIIPNLISSANSTTQIPPPK